MASDLLPLAVTLNQKLVRWVKVIPKLDGLYLQQHLN
jgi:hypothetical protein